MFGFLAAIFSAVWISEHITEILIILAVLLALLVWRISVARKRRAAYLALPVVFIGNRATKTYHTAGCSALSHISPQHRVAFRLRDETVRMGYTPCGLCKPRWPKTK